MKGKILKKLFSLTLSAVMLTGTAGGLTVLPSIAASAAGSNLAVSALENTSTVSSGSITLGQYVTVKASASGGSGGCTFALQYINKDKDTSWKLKRYYSSYPTINFKPTETGNYYLYVKAKDSSGTVVGKRFALKVYPDVVNKSTVSKSEIYLGDTVTVNARASGGAGGNTYAVLYKKSSDSSWSVKQFYNTNTAVDIKPAKDVDYDIAVKVKDKNGRIVEKKFTLKVYPKLKNVSSVSASSIELGKSVTVNGAASGGKPGYTYSLLYKEKNDSAYSTARAKGSDSKMTFTPEKAGTYTLCVIARDVKNTAVKKYFNIEVTQKLDEVGKILAEAIRPGMSDIEKIRAIHNWLVRNVSYDIKGYEAGNIPATSFTAEGLFKTRVAVCDGYSKAFSVLAARAGFEVGRVTGIVMNSLGTSEAHAWNQIKYNGNWYNIDVTWDDPVTDADYGDNLSYKYFLVPDSVLYADHVARSSAYSCNAPQPVSEFIDKVIEEEKQDNPNIILCNTDNEFKNVVSKINVRTTKTTDIIFKTDMTFNKIRSVAFENMPAGSYSMNYSYKSWKFEGYICFSITVKPGDVMLT